MTWWLWAFLGLFLLGGELVTPGGFYMLFFGIGALGVGALVGLDVIQSEWVSWLLFSAFSIGSLLISFLGALILLAIVNLIRRGRAR